MKKYKNKRSSKECEVLDFIAAGMCQYTMGKTFVIFRYEGSKDAFNLVMEQSEFLKNHEAIKIVKGDK